MRLKQRKRVLAHRLDYIVRFNVAWKRAFERRRTLFKIHLKNLELSNEDKQA